MKTVTPKAFTGWSMSIFQMFGSGPKFTIVCGACQLAFKKRIQMVSNQGVRCPYCETMNVLPLQVSDNP